MAESYLCKKCMIETLKRMKGDVNVASEGYDPSKMFGMRIIQLGFWALGTQMRFRFLRLVK